MLSDFEIKHMLETAFLPERCVCSVIPYGSISIQIFEHGSGEPLLTVAGISRVEVASSRSIVNLVGQVREEIRLRELVDGRDFGTGQRCHRSTLPPSAKACALRLRAPTC